MHQAFSTIFSVDIFLDTLYIVALGFNQLFLPVLFFLFSLYIF